MWHIQKSALFLFGLALCRVTVEGKTIGLMEAQKGFEVWSHINTEQWFVVV
jgi:hypothetical protein